MNINDFKLLEKPLGKLCIMTNGSTKEQSKTVTDFPITRIESISDGFINKKKVNYVEFSEKESDSYRLDAGDILFSHINSFERVGHSAIVKELDLPIYHGMNLLRIKPNTEEILPEYLFLFFKTSKAKAFYEEFAQRAINQASINQNTLKSLIVTLPKEKKDQKNIITYISTKLNAVEEMRQAALQQKEAVEALQGALLREVFPYKEGDELPKGWRWDKIDKLAKVGKTRKKKIASNPKELTSFVPMDSVDDVTGRITKTLYRPYEELGQSYTYFENGDIIFAKITPCMQNGKCAIVSEMKDDFGFGSSEYIVLTPTKPAYAKWVHYFLRTVELRRAAEEHFTGSAGQQRVPTDFIQKYPIPIPDDDNLIETLTSALDKKHQEYFILLNQSVTQLEAIKALPAAILREVFEFKTNQE